MPDISPTPFFLPSSFASNLQLARSIQLNTSTAVADEAAKWVNDSLVYNNLRRLLQVKAIDDANYTTVLINITRDIL